MSIDFHAHLAREDPNAPFFMRDLFDVEGYLEKQERAGIERTVLSFALEDEGDTPSVTRSSFPPVPSTLATKTRGSRLQVSWSS